MQAVLPDLPIEIINFTYWRDSGGYEQVPTEAPVTKCTFGRLLWKDLKEQIWQTKKTGYANVVTELKQNVRLRREQAHTPDRSWNE